MTESERNNHLNERIRIVESYKKLRSRWNELAELKEKIEKELFDLNEYIHSQEEKIKNLNKILGDTLPI